MANIFAADISQNLSLNDKFSYFDLYFNQKKNINIVPGCPTDVGRVWSIGLNWWHAIVWNNSDRVPMTPYGAAKPHLSRQDPGGTHVGPMNFAIWYLG